MNFGRKMMKAGVAAVAAIATLGAGGVVASTAFAGGGGGNQPGTATLWAHKALSAGRPLPFGVKVVSRFTVAAPAEEESWRSTSR